MNDHAENWVPKVHPLTRSVEAEDPMELVPTMVEGDPEVMLESFVQEFAQMGYGEAELLALFTSPAYPVLHQLGVYYGEARLRQRIGEMLERTGVFRFHEVIDDEPDPDEDDEPELIQLTVRRR